MCRKRQLVKGKTTIELVLALSLLLCRGLRLASDRGRLIFSKPAAVPPPAIRLVSTLSASGTNQHVLEQRGRHKGTSICQSKQGPNAHTPQRHNMADCTSSAPEWTGEASFGDEDQHVVHPTTESQTTPSASPQAFYRSHGLREAAVVARSTWDCDGIAHAHGEGLLVLCVCSA